MISLEMTKFCLPNAGLNRSMCCSFPGDLPISKKTAKVVKGFDCASDSVLSLGPMGLANR